MGTATRRALIGCAVGAATLVLGHWVAVLLAEAWWVQAVAPEAAAFAVRWTLWTATCELLSVLGTGAWFAVNLTFVSHAIGSIQLPRRLGGIEIREAVPREAHLPVIVGLSVLFAVLLGGSGPRAAVTLALAWHGLHVGLTDPVLGRDAGLYVAQLPLWIGGLAVARRLIWGALAVVSAAYLALGALRVGRSGVAISNHVRVHLGLLTCAALLLSALQTTLYPVESVAGTGGFGALPSSFQTGMCGTLTLLLVIGAALLAGWAWRGRPASLTVGLVTAGLALLFRTLLPALGPSATTLTDLRTFTEAAWGMGGLAELQLATSGGASSLPTVPVWSAPILAGALGAGADVAYVGRVAGTAPDLAGPVWGLVAARADSVRLFLVADDRINAAGGPLSYRADDSVPYPGLIPYVRWPRAAVRPGAPAWVLGAQGVSAAGAVRRLALAWAVQAPAVFRSARIGSGHLAWHLDPAERAAQLFPPAEWGAPQLILVAGRPVWAVPGFLSMKAFPLSPRLEWGGRTVGGVDPGLVALVDPESGATRIFLRPGAGPVARAWSDIAVGVIHPDSTLPAEARAELPYPREWLEAQARVLASGGFALPADSAASGGSESLMVAWDLSIHPESSIPMVDSGASALLAALLSGPAGAGLRPRLVRYDRRAAPPAPRGLARRWEHFASYGELADTIQMTGDRLVAGPVNYSVAPESLVATQTVFRVNPQGVPAVVRFNLATGNELGAGPTTGAAWANLGGRTAPPLPPSPEARFGEIRRWAVRADSALRRGDSSAAARALAAIEALVNAP